MLVAYHIQSSGRFIKGASRTEKQWSEEIKIKIQTDSRVDWSERMDVKEKINKIMATAQSFTSIIIVTAEAEAEALSIDDDGRREEKRHIFEYNSFTSFAVHFAESTNATTAVKN